MGKTLKEIRKPIEPDYVRFQKVFREALSSKAPMLDRITRYIVRRKGKQMRPMFVLLSAGVAGTISEKTYRGASLVELLHTATLVHDDVVDDSMFRRNLLSINAIWKNKIAVLVGDYLFSKGMLLSVQNKDYDLLELVSNAVREMSEGELLQVQKAMRLDIDETVYFEVIRQKTASLIASACAVGAASATDDEEVIEKFRLFGEKIGIAFQIKDDLFDFGTDDVGKPLGIDIKEKKMTLPLIHALKQSSQLKRLEMTQRVRWNGGKKERIQKVIDFVRTSGGLEYATNKMQTIKSDALTLLDDFPDSEMRSALIELVEFAVARKK